MSAPTVVLIVESVLLAVALLFVVALLRSHAEILRRLVALEGRRPGPATAAGARDSAPEHLVGETPSGDVVKVSLRGGHGRTLLAFLSSGCGGCAPLWEGLRPGLSTPAGTRLIAVTKGPERESPSRLRSLGPFSHEVVMSSTAFEELAIPATPHFVLVGAGGEIQGQGSAGSWEQILRLLGDADADLSGARTSSERAERAERALAAAGITAEHPSLYPSRGHTAGP